MQCMAKRASELWEGLYAPTRVAFPAPPNARNFTSNREPIGGP
jgi:hypothetical protein